MFAADLLSSFLTVPSVDWLIASSKAFRPVFFRNAIWRFFFPWTYGGLWTRLKKLQRALGPSSAPASGVSSTAGPYSAPYGYHRSPPDL